MKEILLNLLIWGPAWNTIITANPAPITNSQLRFNYLHLKIFVSFSSVTCALFDLLARLKHLSCLCFENNCVYKWLFQYIVIVVDSTDRDRLSITKAELYKMIAHEVCECFYKLRMIKILVNENFLLRVESKDKFFSFLFSFSTYLFVRWLLMNAHAL